MMELMAERKPKAAAETGGAKVVFPMRVPPDLKAEFDALAEEISRDRYPASITAAELAVVAMREYAERYRKAKRSK